MSCNFKYIYVPALYKDKLQKMTNSINIIIIATLIHIAAIVYGIINGYWDAVILAIILLGSSLIYYFNKCKKDKEWKNLFYYCLSL